jgi:hypothetical protein
VSFPYMLMKNPDFDPTYRTPDRENTWLGVVLVLGPLGPGFSRDLFRLAIKGHSVRAVYLTTGTFATEIATRKSPLRTHQGHCYCLALL